jgi:hypothetical protein
MLVANYLTGTIRVFVANQLTVRKKEFIFGYIVLDFILLS